MPSALMRSTGVTLACVVVGLLSVRAQGQQAVPAALAHYKAEIQPILVEHCYACHAEGGKKGQVSFDTFKSDQEALDPGLWLRVLKNVRAGIMPPSTEPRLKPEQMARLEKWIKTDAFGIDSQNPDPGRVTLRRMNRTEYRNTVRDLMGIDFRVEEEFPPDDSGYGFDNIGDVLSVSPMLLEKYMAAAETIVAQAVPKVSKVVQEKVAFGAGGARGGGGGGRGGTLSLKTPGSATQRMQIDQAGDYRVTVEVTVNGSFDFDPAKALMTFKVDDKELFNDNYQWQGGRRYEYVHVLNWEPGERTFTFDMQPTNQPPPATQPEEGAAPAQVGGRGRPNTTADMRIVAVRVQGPLDESRWIAPPNYTRFFHLPDPPKADPERKAYAREVLNKFATRAFRRPVDEKTLDRLVAIAEAVYTQPDKRFEHGVSQAMVAVLASPRFIFRTEMPVLAPGQQAAKWAPIDEYALASRLSYFLWSTMPDDALFDLAAKGQLRQNQEAQFKRMLADNKSNAFVQNFTGQWLQVRDIETIVIDAEVVLARDAGTEAELRAQQEAARAGRGRGRGRGQQNQQNQNQQQNQQQQNQNNPNANPQQQVNAQQNQAQVDAQQEAARQQDAAQQVLQAQQPAAPNAVQPNPGQPNAAQPTPAAPAPAQAQADPAQPQAQPAQGQPQQQQQAAAQGRGRGGRGRGNRGNAPQAPAAPTLDTPLRRAMQQETELYFNYILREDRSALELLSSNYTFLNARLAQHYGIEGVQGQEMQRVELPADSPRGGILTQGSVLVVTSNITRTSPVKRGLFILDNILGTPAPPAPPDVPEIEAAEKTFAHEPTMRELMQAHREKPLCNACHMRMDSLGLALENFNALGMWRGKERNQAIDSSGQLITGENLTGVADLKKVLTTSRRADFYTCLAEKVLTYALGRGLEHYDTEAVDRIVAQLEANDGKMSTLLMGVIDSVPFQKMRLSNTPPVVAMQEQ